MEVEESRSDDPSDKTSHIAQGSAQGFHDEDSVSYIKPIIQELVRTQVCFPNIKLLVDRISIVQVPSAPESDGLQAYLMYLTDREKTIQGSCGQNGYLTIEVLITWIYQLS